MARSPHAKNPSAGPRPKVVAARSKPSPRRAKTEAPTPPLPDPKDTTGPRRPFRDPGWAEAWWWLGIPLAVGAFALAAYQISPDWERRWVASEGIGFLELTQFALMVVGFAIAVQLLFDPFVRRRPLVFAVTLLAGLSCLYIGGEEVSWGQHIFYWDESGLISDQNHGELSIHNMHEAFETAPRSVLEIGVVVGGLLVPLACLLIPRLRAGRFALFWPAAALAPTAALFVLFKLIDVSKAHLLARPSEALEFYLYYFVLLYLVVFERRISALERDAAGSDPSSTGSR